MARIKNKIQRQIERYLSTENIGSVIDQIKLDLTDAADKTASFALLDGLDPMLVAIEETYQQYEDKAKMALRNLEISSRELNEVNTKLDSLNQSIEAMLESLGPALLFFNEQGICSPVFSKSCLTLLNMDPGNKPIWDVLEIGSNDVKNFVDLIAFVFNNKSAMSFDDIFDFAPGTFAKKEAQNIMIEFKPIMDRTGKIEAILVIATDKSHERATEDKLKIKEKYAEKLIRMVQKKNYFYEVIDDVEAYCLGTDGACMQNAPDIHALKNDLHTLKGLVSSFYMDDLTDIIQNIEQFIHYESNDLAVIAREIPDWQEKIRGAIARETDFADTIFGVSTVNPNHAESLSHDMRKQLGDLIAAHAGAIPPALQHFLNDHFIKQHIFAALEIFDFHLHETAARLNKKILPTIIQGKDIHLTANIYDAFFKSLVHMARNAVDHGIEDPSMRPATGKPEAAQITITVTEKTYNNAPGMEIVIRDDGRGIDPHIIAQKIGGTTNLTDTQIIQKIFDDGFSSRDKVTNISGRGVGLAAVKKEITDLGGQIRVESTVGIGTAFIIDLPVL